ncbi:conserved exported hypothetical protein [Verrucomicrobia bacterium]|nr:conserved exported hypothetical protein [Verrucomicrobiota bacterium]
MRQMAQHPKASLRRRCLRTLALCAGLYLLACVGCASFQRRLIYFPPIFSAAQTDKLAEQEGLEPWRGVDGRPLGWMRLSRVSPSLGQVLIMHGNACCAFQCAHYADAIQPVAALDVFIVEYPGYADRPGAPSERTLEASSSEGFQALATNRPIYLVGESLGTGVAACLAGRYPDKVSGLVLLAPYNRLADVAQVHMPIFPVHLLLCDRFPAEDYLRSYHGPVAVLVAGRDLVVPEKFGRRLFDGYAGPKRLWEFPRLNHGSIMYQPAEVWKQIVAFWQSAKG